jgi:colanic acid/amylovoran biosynthesis glycosyltransferase
LLPLAVLYCLFCSPQRTTRYLREASKRWGIVAALRRFYLDAAFIALRPDLIHFEFGALAVEQADLKTLLGCRVIVSFRGYDLNFSGLDRPDYYRTVWQQADAVHLLGQDLWNRAMRRGCPANKPHALISPAIDVGLFSPVEDREFGLTGTSDRPLRVLSVGRLEWKKGYEFALQAVKLLRVAGVECKYRIVGSGEALEALTFARYQLGLESCVEFLGGLAQHQVAESMAWADVLLHAAVSEGFGNAVLEAQAMQLPVVCSDADGLPENVDHGVTGFIVQRRDPQALAERLILLSHSPALRERLGRAGRQRVEEKFSLPHQIEQFDQLYRGLLNSER